MAKYQLRARHRHHTKAYRERLRDKVLLARLVRKYHVFRTPPLPPGESYIFLSDFYRILITLVPVRVHLRSVQRYAQRGIAIQAFRAILQDQVFAGPARTGWWARHIAWRGRRRIRLVVPVSFIKPHILSDLAVIGPRLNLRVEPGTYLGSTEERLWRYVMDHAGQATSVRALARQLGMSHHTILNYLRRWVEQGRIQLCTLKGMGIYFLLPEGPGEVHHKEATNEHVDCVSASG